MKSERKFQLDNIECHIDMMLTDEMSVDACITGKNYDVSTKVFRILQAYGEALLETKTIEAKYKEAVEALNKIQEANNLVWEDDPDSISNQIGSTIDCVLKGAEDE